MLGPVKRRFLRILVPVLVAAQLLSLAPMSWASSAAAAGGMHCAGMMMPSADDSEPCPCCPDGMTKAACLAACAAHAAVIPSFFVPMSSTTFEPVRIATFLPRTETADPPLKPPPIV